MDGLKLIWAPIAIRQRDFVFNYWNQRNKSKSYSKKLNLAIRERTDLLKLQPELGKEIGFNNIRMIAMRHYSLFYKFNSDTLFILGFWDNRQDSKKLIKGLS